jgi:hypothetical protein
VAVGFMTFTNLSHLEKSLSQEPEYENGSQLELGWAVPRIMVNHNSADFIVIIKFCEPLKNKAF